METLARAGFTVREAFPGQTAGLPPRPVAVVGLKKVEGRRIALSVHVLSPAARGGSACEEAALSAGRVLEAAGAECIQNACEYDGVARIYRVELEAVFQVGEKEVIHGPGFQVWLDDLELPWVVGFRSERLRKQAQTEPPLENGEFTEGVPCWEFCLEQRIPQDCAKPELPEYTFTLRVKCGESHEVYAGCSCGSILREYSREGLTQIFKGMCTGRTVRIGD